MKSDCHTCGAHEPVLDVQNLTLHYGARKALDAVSFKVFEGERVAILGPNGAGKSTLFKILSGVERPEKGCFHTHCHGGKGHICFSYVPQRSQVDWMFPVTVRDVVMMGRVGDIGLFRKARRSDHELVDDCLSVVDLTEQANRQINELSGGQQQRMFIARALAQQAEVMLMDEPLAGLDLPSQDDIFRILDALKEQKVTVLVATHDMHRAANDFDRVMLLNQKLWFYGNPADALQPDPLRNTFGDHLQMVKTDTGLLVVSDSCCDHGAPR